MDKISLGVIRDNETLKFMGLKKPILVVENGNKIIKVASFNNEEMLNLFLDALEQYGFKIQFRDKYF